MIALPDLVLVPPTLACGGFQNVIQDAVLWLGSGQTMSVLHFDTLDNLLCLFDGKKDLVLIDPVGTAGVALCCFLLGFQLRFVML